MSVLVSPLEASSDEQGAHIRWSHSFFFFAGFISKLCYEVGKLNSFDSWKVEILPRMHCNTIAQLFITLPSLHMFNSLSYTIIALSSLRSWFIKSVGLGKYDAALP